MRKVIIAVILLSGLIELSCSIRNQSQPSGKGVVPVKNYNPVSKLFKVKANGIALQTGEFRDVSFVSFIQDGELTVSVEYAEPITSFVISPLDKQITGNLINPNSLQFKLSRASYLVITINNKERLFMFAETSDYKSTREVVNVANYKLDRDGINTQIIQRAITETAAKKQTLFFPTGVYKTGKLNIPSNTKILMAPGAVLKASDDLKDLKNDTSFKGRGFLRIQNAENVEIKGLGVIDGNGRLLRDKYADEARFRIFLIVSSKNIVIDGVTARDPGSWNTQIMYSDHVLFNKVKLLNDPALANTDGFDPDASSYVTIENCFAYCGDDNVAIKVTDEKGPVKMTSDIIVKGCVFLTRKSSLKVGTESRGVSIKNVLFEDNDVIMSDRGMALYCSDGATYENIKFVDNRFETNYPDAKKMGIHFTINKRNPSSNAGEIRNVLVKNCSFQKPFPKNSEIEGFDSTHRVGVLIENLKIGDKVCKTLADAGIKLNQFADVVFK